MLRLPLAVPSEIMFPHDGVGGGTDSPRKASDPSRTITPATVISPKVTATGTTLGRISRNRIRGVVAPMVRAAITKSRLANERLDALTTRNIKGIVPTPMMMVILRSDDPQKATMAMTATMAGKARSCLLYTSDAAD